MPMEISPAPEVFQCKSIQALEGLPRIKVAADDILVLGEGATKEEALWDHDIKLRQPFCRCPEKSIKLNAEKNDAKKNRGTLHMTSVDI